VKKAFMAISLILVFLTITGMQSLAQDVIHVCINNAGHARFVGDPSECKTSETPKSWYVVGPQGPQGEDGLHCWDLNGNSVCDPEEDVDGIAGCGAGDCQGSPGVGGVHVRDSSVPPQDLGLLVDVNKVYNESLGKFIQFNLETGDIQEIAYFVYYQYQGCTGDAYLSGSYTHSYYDYIVIKTSSPHSPGYYVTTPGLAQDYPVQSYYDYGFGCNNRTNTIFGKRIIEISELPFEVSVQLPLVHAFE
jgi:hypothetical protein